MTNQNLLRSQSVKGVTQARMRGTPAKRKRKPFTLAWLSLLASVLAMAVIFALAPRFGRDGSPHDEVTTGDIDTHSLGAIISDDGTMKCAHATFDNRTGKISHGPAPCQTTTIVDGQQVPAPLGTTHTLNAISNTFK